MKYLSENMKSLGKILLVMYAVTAILLFLLAVFVQRFQLKSGAISVGVCIIYVISCFLGGFFAGKVQKAKKFLWGLLIGLVYIVIMSAVTLAVKRGFDIVLSGMLLNLLLCLGSGMLGGMVS